MSRDSIWSVVGFFSKNDTYWVLEKYFSKIYDHLFRKKDWIIFPKMTLNHFPVFGFFPRFTYRGEKLFSSFRPSMLVTIFGCWWQNFDTGGNMKCPKKHAKDDFVMWWNLPIYLKCPKIEEFHFRFLFCSKIDHVRIIRNAPFFHIRNIWNAPFSPFSESHRKNGAFQIFRT